MGVIIVLFTIIGLLMYLTYIHVTQETQVEKIRKYRERCSVSSIWNVEFEDALLKGEKEEQYYFLYCYSYNYTEYHYVCNNNVYIFGINQLPEDGKFKSYNHLENEYEKITEEVLSVS